jgi:hypothetical protein
MENRRYLVVITILLLTLVVVALSACGETSPLVGKWQYTEDVYIEFFNDGQYEIVMRDGVIGLSGTYEETGDSEITLTPLSRNGEDVDEEPTVMEHSISGDELIMDDGYEPITFTRK